MSQLPELPPDIQKSELYKKVLGNQPLQPQAKRQNFFSRLTPKHLVLLGVALFVSFFSFLAYQYYANTQDIPSQIQQISQNFQPTPTPPANNSLNFFGFSEISTQSSQTFQHETTTATVLKPVTTIVIGKVDPSGNNWKATIQEAIAVNSSDPRLESLATNTAQPPISIQAININGQVLSSQQLTTDVDGNFQIAIPLPVGTNAIQLVTPQRQALDKIFVTTSQFQVALKPVQETVSKDQPLTISGYVRPVDQQIYLEFNLYSPLTQQVYPLNQGRLTQSGYYELNLNLTKVPISRTSTWQLQVAVHTPFSIQYHTSEPFRIVVN